MRIACLGGAHLDTKAHLEAPPLAGTSNPARTTRAPGGVACNVARNLARLGSDVVLCSLVGDDATGAALRATLTAEGIDCTGLTVLPGRTTAAYLAVLDPDGALVIGVADMGIYAAADESWTAAAADTASGADLWVIDTNLPIDVLAGLVERAPVPVMADPVSAPKAERLEPILGGLAAVFPDAAEAAVLAGSVDPDPIADAERIVGFDTAEVVVSLGARGVYRCTADGGESREPFSPRQIVDVTGAGDALLAGYAYATAAGEADPLAWGLAAASLAVETYESVPEHLSVQTIRERIAGAV
jgi:pseudouridine kinase